MIDRSDHISRKIGLYSLYGYFLATTFSHALAQNLLGIAMIVSIILFFKENRSIGDFKLDFFKASIFLFIIWSVVSALAGSTPEQSIFMLKEEWLFLVIPVAGFLIRTKKELYTSIGLFATACVIISGYAFYQHFNGMDLYRGEPLDKAESFGYRSIAFFSHRLTCGNYFAIASLFFLGLTAHTQNIRFKILYYLAFLTSTLTVVFTQSRGPLLAIIIGIAVFILTISWRYARYALIAVVVLILTVAIVSPDIYDRYSKTIKMELSSDYSGSRLAIFGTSVKIIKINLLTGVGPGNYRDSYINYRAENSKRIYTHAHNDFLNVAAYSGIPGAIAFLAIWIAILIRIYSSFKRCARDGIPNIIPRAIFLATIGFFLTSMYEATFADEEIRMMLMALWGLYIAWEQIVKRNGKTDENIEKA